MLRSILSSVLIFAFVMAGANKITDAIHAETHQELAKGFVQYGPIWGKIVTEDLKIPTDSALYKAVLDDGSNTFKIFMSNIGMVELGAAVAIFSPLRPVALSVLAFIMAAATYTHHVVKDEVGKTMVPAVLGAMCVLAMLPASKPAAKSGGKRKTK